MADAVAIVSVISGAAVGLGVPLINAQLERRRLQDSTLQARIDEVRSVLDDAATAAFESGRSVADLHGAFETGDSPWTAAASTALEDFEPRPFEMARQDLRLAMRVGPSAPLRMAYSKMVTAYAETYLLFRAARREERPPDFDRALVLARELKQHQREFEAASSEMLGM